MILSMPSMKMRLRQERARKFISQADLAERSGVSKQTIIRLERPDFDGQPNWATIRKLAEALGVEPDALVVKE